MKSAGLVFGFCVYVAACSHDVAPEVKGAPSTPAPPAIFTLQTHDAKVSVLAGDLRVAITRDDATTIATLDELRARDPELFQIVTSAVAQRGTYLDATLDRPAPHEIR